MKKIFLSTIATFCAFTWLSAQNTSAGSSSSDGSSPKSFIGINSGYAMAFGALTKNDYKDPGSGYASKGGLNYGLEGNFILHKNFGIAAVFSCNSFFTAGLQTMADGYKDDFDVDSTTVTTTKKYSFYNFFAGPSYSIACNKLTFDFRFVAGLTHGTTPEFKVDLEDQTNATFYQKSSKANSFGFQAGAGVRYLLFSNVCLKLNADYYSCKPDFMITNENRANNAGRLLTEYHEPISVLSLNAGVSYQFGK